MTKDEQARIDRLELDNAELRRRIVGLRQAVERADIALAEMTAALTRAGVKTYGAVA